MNILSVLFIKKNLVCALHLYTPQKGNITSARGHTDFPSSGAHHLYVTQKHEKAVFMG